MPAVGLTLPDATVTGDAPRLNPSGAVPRNVQPGQRLTALGMQRNKARRAGLAPSAVTINERIEIPDGGVDASVSGSLTRSDSALIAGRTRFQIKGGQRFEPWTPSHLKRELFDKKPPSRSALAEEVAECLQSGGRYVLVSFGHDLTTQRRRRAESDLRTLLAKCGFPDAHVEVWGAGQVLGFLRVFPSLCLTVNGAGGLDLQSLESWSQNLSMTTAFVPGQPQRDLVDQITVAVRGDVRHVRLTGEPGLGKTRLVLEALRNADTGPLVLYSEHAERFRNSPLLRDILRSDNPFHALVVVDDCSSFDLGTIWDLVQPRSERIRLVTIAHDHDCSTDAHGQTLALRMPPLAREQIEAILRGYDAPNSATHRWADLCDGSPRVAHVIGLNLRSNPEDVLAPPTHSNVWERFIVGADDRDSPLVRQRWVVLRYLAMFLRFGFEPPVAGEGQAIAELIREADPQVTPARFCEIVQELRDRRILQGASTLRIVPRALHVWLWIEWWDRHGPTFQPSRFLGQPGRLRTWFFEMFRYGSSSPRAGQQAQALLLDPAFLNDDTISSHAGGSDFNALTDACPEGALQALERTIGRWPDDALQNFGTGRRGVIFALETIAMSRALFHHAGCLLRRLAECENERCGNNATGVFAGLFSLAYGSAAPTEAPPEERIPLLRSTVFSDRIAWRRLGLEACRVGLSLDPPSRMLGAEFRGLVRSSPWQPATYGPIFEAYRRIWAVTVEAWRAWQGEERVAAGRLLVEAGQAFLDTFLAVPVLDTFDELAADGAHARELLNAAHAAQVDRDDEDPEIEQSTLDRLRSLCDRLTGTSLSERVRRHVGMDLEAEHPLSVGWTEADQAIKATLRDLARECMADRATLMTLMPWLMGPGVDRAMHFAIELGRLPDGLDLLDDVIALQAAEGATLLVLSGLLRVLREQDLDAWHARLDAFASDSTCRQWVPELTWRCSWLDERAARRVERVVAEGGAPATVFAMWRWGTQFSGLDQAVVEAWIRLLLAAPEPRAASTALTLLSSYFCRHQETALPLPGELARAVLLATLPPRRDREPGTDSDWGSVATAYFVQFPEDSVDMFVCCVRGMLEAEGRRVPLADDRSTNALRGLFCREPAAAWQGLVPLLVDCASTSFVLRWLQGREAVFGGRGAGCLHRVPRELLWQWVDIDPVERAPSLARHVLNSFDGEEGALTREVLARCGGVEDVLGELHANFTSEGWSGSEAEHYRRRLTAVVRWIEGETNEHVLRWLAERRDTLTRRVNAASVEEERDE